MRKQLKIILSCTAIMANGAYAQQFTNNKKEVIMVNTLQEKQQRNAATFFSKVDAGQFDSEYYGLFTEDVELYFPNFGFGKGKESSKEFGVVMSGFLPGLSYDIENYNYVISNNTFVAEGTEKGITIDGRDGPDNVTSSSKFCNVFEFEGELIKRIHIYFDPDSTSEDSVRMTRLDQEKNTSYSKSVDQATKAVIEEFFQIQSGKKQGNVAELFADLVDFDLAGNERKFPWVGKRSTKKEVEEYFKILWQNIKSEKFEVEFIAVDGENAVAVGNLSSVILKYNKLFNTQFSNIFKVRDGKIVKFHFMEDGYRLNEEMK